MDRRFETVASEIAELQRSQREIDRAISRKRQEQLKTLPALVALRSHDELVLAIRHLCSPELRERLNGFNPKPIARRRTVHYGTNMRIRVRAELESGKTLAAVSAITGVSQATVAKWKKQMGLQVRRHRRAGSRGPDALGTNGAGATALNGEDSLANTPNNAGI